MTYSSNSSSTSFDLLADVSETQFLKSSIVNHTKYGSTNQNSVPQMTYHYITHFVDSNDTFQGLALKYGCKIEDLKKVNKLYSDDNNFLRSRLQLLIPLEVSKKSDLNNAQSCISSPTLLTDSQEGSCSKRNAPKHSQSVESDSKTKKISKSATTINQSLSLCDSVATTTTTSSTSSDTSFSDFLHRIDSSIAQSKNQVEKMSQKNGENSIEHEISKLNSGKFTPPKVASPEMYSQLRTSTSSRSMFSFENDSSSSILPRVSTRNNKNSRKIKQLQKSQEEMFEL